MTTQYLNRPRSLASCLAAFMFGTAALAQSEPEDASELVTVSASVMEGAISPGVTAHIAVRFDLVPQWHIYWKNAGATGMPTAITVNTPAGFTVGGTLFPAPHRFTDDVLGDSYGYEHQTVLFVPVTASETVSTESATFEVLVDYLVCKKQCLIGSAEIEVIVPVGNTRSAAPVDPSSKRHWDQIPVPLESVDGASLLVTDDELILVVPDRPGDLKSIVFFPEDTPGVRYEPLVNLTSQAGLTGMGIPIEVKPQNARGKPLRVAGVITVGNGNDRRAYAFDRPIIGPNHDGQGSATDRDVP